MRSARQWFDLYGQSHQNRINKAIHWICIPAIVVATLGLLQSVPMPAAWPAWAHLGTAVAAASLVFYARLSWTLAVGMAAVAGSAIALNHGIVASGASLPWVSIGLFVAAWAVQFVGHHIEGAKPSFAEDVQFLLIGPAWLLQFVYGRVGIPVEPASRAPVA